MFLSHINKTDNYLNKDSLRSFLTKYFCENGINIKNKEIDILIRGMDTDRFNHYKRE